MSYIVLARKHRPQNFDEVIGQEHITDLLKSAISSGRIGHAFLFCGPRGIGKTSCARILAKALNCQKGPSGKPCDACDSCLQIIKGNSFDVLEIDGASNRGIEEIRSLRENVKFAPSYGKYKIYIIDEVHMLTAEAFNALLKTLEEPPEHVKFIFATTSPNKVPSTIISRCQRFDFKRITLKIIAAMLTDIATKEKIQVDADALFAIAKAADGSFRDSLSILDQMSAIHDRKIIAGDVFSMLGLVETQFLFDLTDAIAKKDSIATLKVLQKIIDQGKDLRQLVKDLTEHFRNLMIVKVGGKQLGAMIDYPVHVKDALLSQTELLTLPEILKAIDAFINVQDTARVTESMTLPLEIALAKLTYRAENAPSVQPQSAVSKPSSSYAAPKPAEAPKTPLTKTISNERGEVILQREKSSPASTEQNVKPSIVRSQTVVEIDTEDAASAESFDQEIVTLEKIVKGWDTLTHAVSRQKMSLATCLQEGVPVSWAAPKLVVGLPKHSSFQKETLEDSSNVRIVEAVLSEKLKTPIAVKYIYLEETQTQTKDEEPIVKSILDTFKGKVVTRWHNE